jgi:hypothetical protein
MTGSIRLLGFVAIAVATPALAQYYPYPAQPGYPGYPGQPYPQQYPYPPQYPQNYPTYPYGYGQGSVGQIIDQLLGNRYSVTDRQAVRQCASAAMVRAQNQYRGYGGYGGYGAYGQGYAPGTMRVTAITDIQRRSSGLRVRGLIDSGYGGYRSQGYGYQGQRYAGGDLTFRCTVDYRGYVSDVRVSRNDRRY